MKEMTQQIAAALLAGVVLTSGVPALAAGVPAGAAPQNAAAVQMAEDGIMLSDVDEEVPLSVDEEVPLSVDEEVPLSVDEEVPLSILPDTPFFHALQKLLKLFGWKS